MLHHVLFVYHILFFTLFYTIGILLINKKLKSTNKQVIVNINASIYLFMKSIRACLLFISSAVDLKINIHNLSCHECSFCGHQADYFFPKPKLNFHSNIAKLSPSSSFSWAVLVLISASPTGRPE